MSKGPLDKLASSDAVISSLSALVIAVTTSLLSDDDD